eukprot:TRINITY_DN7482_c0_g1_i1.p1 TRINITY_DN7482_c0_g1~~TRINITY_DN7482_c0_g1_i1.p1  ORF type:complete len:520 (+),score=119.84 TRINITY_DN7482_c0_g1_i1:25-1560(+)
MEAMTTGGDLSEAELQALSKEDLIRYILSTPRRRDELHTTPDPPAKRSRATLVSSHHESSNNKDDDATKNSSETNSNMKRETAKQKQKKKKKDDFSIDNYALRHIALRIAYIGGAYQGFASQRHTTETVESKLFSALVQARLIDVGSLDVSQPITSTSELAHRAVYSRCGRTDKGVSAFGQVVALHLRSNLIQEDIGVVSLPTNAGGSTAKPNRKENDYASILNGLLPDDIRIIGWAPVPLNFNARFSCLYRTYKYYFLASGMNIDKMKEAAKLLVGDHDFRNFCKIDAVNVFNFRRIIVSLDIKQSSDFKGDNYSAPFYEATICGYAFLWHQIRCIMAVLFMVGKGVEQPQIVSELLDVEKNPRKPFYDMASEVPLVLYDCGFEGINFISDAENHRRVCDKFEQRFQESMMSSLIVFGMLQGMRNTYLPSTNGEFAVWSAIANERKPAPKHIPLLRRAKEETLEEKVQKMNEKKKKVYEQKISKRGPQRCHGEADDTSSFVMDLCDDGDE